MLTVDQRRAFMAKRNAGRKAVTFCASHPSEINEIISIVEPWRPGPYTTNDVRQHDGIPYRCVQGHDSTANPSWTPDATPALWMQYHGTSAATARPYLQPQGAHDAYQTGEYATEGGTVYRCRVNGTVYPPSVLPGSWEAA